MNNRFDKNEVKQSECKSHWLSRIALTLQTTVQNHGEGDGTPLQHSRLENPMDGGAWWAAVHGVTKSQTRLNDFTLNFHFQFSLSRIGEGTGNSIPCSCLEDPRDWGAWWPAVFGVTRSQTRLKQLSSSSSSSPTS